MKLSLRACMLLCSPALEEKNSSEECFVCNPQEEMKRVFDAVKTCPDLQIARVKDRWSNPTRDGWADLMLNVVLNDDPSKHVCEVT